MSYDLMVFDPSAPPSDREGFMAWYTDQTNWSEDHSYDDPNVTTDALRAWFLDMIERFPAMNGSYASKDYDSPYISDYCIGRSVIYVGFRWSLVQEAYSAVFKSAKKHRVGLFDVSADDGEVWLPLADDGYLPIHGNGRSSVELGEAHTITLTGSKTIEPDEP